MDADKVTTQAAGHEPQCRIPLDDRRTLVLTIEEKPRSPSWQETLEAGKKWMRFFHELGI